MGQLRSGIENLTKTSVAVTPQIAELEKQSVELSEKVLEAAQRVTEGLNVLVMTVEEKIKQDKIPADVAATKTLKEVANPAVATVIKGIIAGKADIKAMIARLNAQQKTSAAALLAATTKAKTDCATLTALAEKKKAKWLKSAKYKAKIGGYLDALKKLTTTLTDALKEIGEASSVQQTDAWVERNFKVAVDMTVKQIRDQASMGYNHNVHDFQARQTQGITHIRGFRDDFKDMGAQFATLGKWVSDADDMEKEADAA